MTRKKKVLLVMLCAASPFVGILVAVALFEFGALFMPDQVHNPEGVAEARVASMLLSGLICVALSAAYTAHQYDRKE